MFSLYMPICKYLHLDSKYLKNMCWSYTEVLPPCPHGLCLAAIRGSPQCQGSLAWTLSWWHHSCSCGHPHPTGVWRGFAEVLQLEQLLGAI